MTIVHKMSRLTIAVAAALTAMSASAGQIAFNPVPVPATDAEMRAVLSSAAVQVNGSLQTGGFHTLIRSGTELPRLVGSTASTIPGDTVVFGGLIQQNGGPLIDSETGKQAVANYNDFNSLIQAGGKLYLVSHFELRPAAMYLTLLDQSADGTLTPVATRPIDFSAVKGGWVHCAGSVTPWGTHLGGEEYEPNAREWVDGTQFPSGVSAYNAAMSGYFGGTGWQFNHDEPTGTSADAKALVNPYDYGWLVEIKVNGSGTTDVTKHYAAGRSSKELGYVMPDNRTVYVNDDGANTTVAMFVADTSGDLSAGTLYAAKWIQLADNVKGGSARLEWVNLGHAVNAQVKAAIDAGKTFSDFFDYLPSATTTPADCVAAGYKTVNKGHDGLATDYECLKIKDGADEAVISRLETRRYAALKGATTEFRKVEGITYNPERRTAYLAMSEVNKGMLAAAAAPANHKGGNDDIHVTRNDCGAVYAMRVGGVVKDTAGHMIASDYVARTMDGLVAGTPVTGDPKNTCDKNGIANPDNLTYLPKYNSLIIGEDTGSGHRNDAVWSYNVLDGQLTRIQTTPYGSETTGVYWFPNVGGHGYLMSVIQHPYGESDQTVPHAADEERGYVGYFKFPVLQ